MIEFTQYLFPHGKKKIIGIEIGQEIEDKYKDLREKGFSFEIENNNGSIWATCINHETEDVVDGFSFNNNDVVEMVNNLVSNSWYKFVWKDL